MVSIFSRLAFAVVALVSFAGASLADDNYSCKKEVGVTGNGAFTEDGAKKKAILAWRNAVIAESGIYYGEPATANEGLGVAVERCARSSIGLAICQARGRPCVAVITGADVECTRDDSKECDPKAKWIQGQLDKQGYDVGRIDGNIGRKSEKAIEAYKKKTGIPDDADIQKVIDSLKGKK